MIKAENIYVYNIARAIYSARNPMNSWDRSDSDLVHDVVGSNDLALARKLYQAGTEHRKYLRQIFVSMDVTAPLLIWKQIDQYKVGTVTNSTSTMHKLTAKPITIEDFSFDGYELYGEWKDPVSDVVIACEDLRKTYLKTKDKFYWELLIRLLPESYNQKRTLTMNYENVVAIIKQRTGHKLKEWADFIEVLKSLPYIKEITEQSKVNKE